MAFVPLANIPVQLADGTTSLNLSGGTLEFFLAGTSTPTNIFSDNSGTVVGTSVTLNSAGYPESGGNVLTLFRDSSVSLKIVGKNLAGTTIWTGDNLKDSLVILASTANAEGASLVGVEDSAGNFADANVEDVLADIGTNYLKDDRNHASITAIYTFLTGSLGMADNFITRPHIGDYAIRHAVVTQIDGTPDFDIASTGANSFVITLTQNATFSISNPSATGRFCEVHIKIIQDGAGGAYTVTWPASVLWPGGTAPTISTGNDAVDDVTLWTIDAGTTWYGNFSQAYA